MAKRGRLHTQITTHRWNASLFFNWKKLFSYNSRWSWFSSPPVPPMTPFSNFSGGGVGWGWGCRDGSVSRGTCQQAQWPQSDSCMGMFFPWRKDRTDSRKLTPDLHTCAVVHTCPSPNINVIKPVRRQTLPQSLLLTFLWFLVDINISSPNLHGSLNFFYDSQLWLKYDASWFSKVFFFNSRKPQTASATQHKGKILLMNGCLYFHINTHSSECVFWQ